MWICHRKGPTWQVSPGANFSAYAGSAAPPNNPSSVRRVQGDDEPRVSCKVALGDPRGLGDGQALPLWRHRSAAVIRGSKWRKWMVVETVLAWKRVHCGQGRESAEGVRDRGNVSRHQINRQPSGSNSGPIPPLPTRFRGCPSAMVH